MTLRSIPRYMILALSILMIGASSACGKTSPANSNDRSETASQKDTRAIAAQSSPWERYADNPIIVPGFEVTPGGPGGINTADPDVLYDNSDGKWKVWFATIFGQGKLDRIGVKYAESTDGKNWDVQPGFALAPASSPNAWDYTNTETPTVVKNPNAPAGKSYMLWYSGGNTIQRKITGDFPYYQIGFATSSDGRHFRRISAAKSPFHLTGMVENVLATFPSSPKVKDGVVGDPEVVLKDGVLHMWFEGLGYTKSRKPVTAGITYATSKNGIEWRAYRKNPLTSLENGNPGEPAQPSVLWNEAKGLYEMWYTNDSSQEKGAAPKDSTLGFWHATSPNGVDWTIDPKQRDFTWDKSVKSENGGIITGAEVILKDGQYSLFYSAYGSKKLPQGWPAPNMWAMDLATRKAD